LILITSIIETVKLTRDSCRLYTIFLTMFLARYKYRSVCDTRFLIKSFGVFFESDNVYFLYNCTSNFFREFFFYNFRIDKNKLFLVKQRWHKDNGVMALNFCENNVLDIIQESSKDACHWEQFILVFFLMWQHWH
jgi:hypothetical protein